MEFFDVLSSHGHVVPRSAVQSMYDLCKRYLRMATAAGVSMKPRAHLFMHLVARTAYQGTPSFYATMQDEGINALLAKIARVAHRDVWEARIFEYFERSLDQKEATKRKRH